MNVNIYDWTILVLMKYLQRDTSVYFIKQYYKLELPMVASQCTQGSHPWQPLKAAVTQAAQVLGYARCTRAVTQAAQVIGYERCTRDQLVVVMKLDRIWLM